MLSRTELHGYQEGAVDFIKTNPRCALWLDMGLGKTVATTTAIADLINYFEASRVLVIAPLRVAVHVWPQEIEAWEHTRHLSARVIRGTATKRLLQASIRDDIHIINRELVEWLVEATGDKWPYDMVVIDESSSFKSHSTRRFRALRKVIPRCDRIVELTGTPISNGYLDAWSQFFLLDQGCRLGRTYTAYRDRFFKKGDYMGFTWTLRPGADKKIQSLVRDLVLRMSSEDYLKLPDVISNRIRVELTPSERAQYRELEKEFLLKLDEADIEAFSAAALSNKLLQFCNGAVYDAEKKTNKIHDHKLDALQSVVEEHPDENLLVAYSYRSDRDRILAKYPNAVDIKDDGAIDKWNAGKIQMLVAHPASAGHGLNLQHGGHIIVWFGLNWSLELYQQFNARLDRQGQTKPVFIHHIVTEDAIDETVLAAVREKDVTQKQLLEAVKHQAEAHTCE